MILAGANQRTRDAHERALLVAHETARLASWAYHRPDKFPKFEPPQWSNGNGKNRDVSSAADDANVRAYFIGMATRSRH